MRVYSRSHPQIIFFSYWRKTEVPPIPTAEDLRCCPVRPVPPDFCSDLGLLGVGGPPTSRPGTPVELLTCCLDSIIGDDREADAFGGCGAVIFEPFRWPSGGVAGRDQRCDQTSSLPSLSGDQVGHFTLEYQWNQFEPSVDRDVFLRRKWSRSSPLGVAEVEEEVAISAVLGPFVRVEHSWDFVPGNVFMKVGVKKTGADPVMLFDCEVMDGDGEPSSFEVRRVSLMPHPIITPHDGFSAISRRQLQRKDDGGLQLRFKDYLIARGIDTRLTDFLLLHLREKEEEQYADWLGTYKQRLKSML